MNAIKAIFNNITFMSILNNATKTIFAHKAFISIANSIAKVFFARRASISIVILILLTGNALLFGQQISGVVFEMNDKTPVESVNISIVGKNVGTASDKEGKYTLHINPEYHNDTLRFSCTGYRSYSVKISDFMELNNRNVGLEKMVIELAEVVVNAKTNKSKNVIRNVWEWFTSCKR